MGVSAKELCDWFAGNSWRTSQAAYKEGQVRNERKDLVPGSNEFYAEVLRLCKEVPDGNDR